MFVAAPDQARVVEMILNAHPEKRRLIFVHIPKCAGTDLTANLGTRYPVIHQTLADSNWTPPERLQAAVDEVEQRLQQADAILVAGHNRLQWVVKNGLYRPGRDRLFSVVREPTEIILSALNYTIGKLVADPVGEQPDTRGWLRSMGVTSVAGWAVRDIALLALKSGPIPRNALCHFLGLGTAESAFDMISASGIEISETSRYSRWAQSAWGLSFTTRHNASKSFVTLDELPADIVNTLCRADAALYPELMKGLGDELSLTRGPQRPAAFAVAVSDADGDTASHDSPAVANIQVKTMQPNADNALGMPTALAAAIAGLPRLDPMAATASSIACKICGRRAPFFDAVDFLKCTAGYPFGPSGILVAYHRCEACGFLFTPFFDNWTKRAFQQFIYNDDYMVVDPEYIGARPVRVAERFADLLAPARGSRVLDWGAGSGIFAGEMARRGFTAESYDPFSAPDVPVGKFDIITCIEAIEHVSDPMQTFRSMTEHLADGGMIIVGETLQPDDIERIRCSWWYVAPRNGHCSTFDRRTMATIADQLGLVFRSQAAGGPHVLHRPEPGALRGIAERLGPAISYFRLGAPGTAGDRWNGVERPAGRPAFQWSAAPELTWDVTVPPGPKRRVIVDLPFVHVIADFIGGCKLRIAGSVASINVRNHTIAAESADVEPGPVRVTFETPPPVRARGADNRMIGIALRVCAE
jgi:hypothetical protein